MIIKNKYHNTKVIYNGIKFDSKKERDRYISQGLSADDAVTQVEQNVAGVQGGYIKETGVLRRFKGSIKNRFKPNP